MTLTGSLDFKQTLAQGCSWEELFREDTTFLPWRLLLELEREGKRKEEGGKRGKGKTDRF